MGQLDKDAGGLYSAMHLLHRAGQWADVLYAAESGGSDLTPRQFAVLKAIADADEPSQSDLVSMTGIDRSTMAEIVSRLVDKGLVLRERTRRDARMYAVRLSPAGEEVLNATLPAVRSTDDKILSVLPSGLRESFLSALTSIVETSGTTRQKE